MPSICVCLFYFHSDCPRSHQPTRIVSESPPLVRKSTTGSSQGVCYHFSNTSNRSMVRTPMLVSPESVVGGLNFTLFVFPIFRVQLSLYAPSNHIIFSNFFCCHELYSRQASMVLNRILSYYPYFCLILRD